MAIRANTGLANIEVNDHGDSITFTVSDNDFLKRLSGFFEWFFSTKEEIENLSSKVNKKESDPTDKDISSSDFEEFNKILSTQERLSTNTQDKLDELFGPGTSKKIFGDISPSYVCVVDVIGQLVDEIERITKEHNQRLDKKYNRNRKGARGNV